METWTVHVSVCSINFWRCSSCHDLHCAFSLKCLCLLELSLSKMDTFLGHLWDFTVLENSFTFMTHILPDGRRPSEEHRLAGLPSGAKVSNFQSLWWITLLGVSWFSSAPPAFAVAVLLTNCYFVSLLPSQLPSKEGRDSRLSGQDSLPTLT
jgi:hypothetical protein